MMKNILKSLGILALGGLSFNSYSQDFKCDTTYHDNTKKNYEIRCENDSVKYVSDFTGGKISFEQSYKKGDLKSQKKIISSEDKIIIKWDLDGDGYHDEVWKKNKGDNKIEIDSDNDGIFEKKSTSEKDRLGFYSFQEKIIANKEKAKKEEQKKSLDALLVKKKIASVEKAVIDSMNYKFQRKLVQVTDSMNAEFKNKIDSMKVGFQNNIDSLKRGDISPYGGNLENVFLAYVTNIKKKGMKTHFDYEIKSHNLSSEANALDLFMGAEQDILFDPLQRLYIIRETEETTYVIPVKTETGYDFSDSPNKIRKDIETLLGEGKTYTISEPANYGGDMLYEISKSIKDEKKQKRKK